MLQSEIDRRIAEVAEYDNQIRIFEKAIELADSGNRPSLPPAWVGELKKLVGENKREQAKSQLMLDALLELQKE